MIAGAFAAARADDRPGAMAGVERGAAPAAGAVAALAVARAGCCARRATPTTVIHASSTIAKRRRTNTPDVERAAVERPIAGGANRSEEHTSELQSRLHLV